jgi:NitT/TauT family transport system substrate-binding protein
VKVSRNRILLCLVVFIVLISGTIAMWTFRSHKPKFSGPPVQIVLGTIPHELSSLIWVAEDRGYFAQNGLVVTIKEYDSGVSAIKDLIADKVEIATAGEFVFVRNSYQSQDLRIVGVIDTYDMNRVVARKDHGIEQLSDLKGKRVGVMRGSQGEFLLARLLTLNSIPSQDVVVVDLSPSQQITSLENGEIDATIVWEPFVQKLKNALGRNAVILPGQSGQDLYWVLVCKDELIKRQPMLVQRFLSALVASERFIVSNKSEAKAIVAQKLGLDAPYLNSAWTTTRFKVLLPQAMLLTMEDQARWLISSGLANKTEIPDFLDFVYMQGLQALKPEAVTIIH